MRKHFSSRSTAPRRPVALHCEETSLPFGSTTVHPQRHPRSLRCIHLISTKNSLRTTLSDTNWFTNPQTAPVHPPRHPDSPNSSSSPLPRHPFHVTRYRVSPRLLAYERSRSNAPLNPLVRQPPVNRDALLPHLFLPPDSFAADRRTAMHCPGLPEIGGKRLVTDVVHRPPGADMVRGLPACLQFPWLAGAVEREGWRLRCESDTSLIGLPLCPLFFFFSLLCFPRYVSLQFPVDWVCSHTCPPTHPLHNYTIHTPVTLAPPIFLPFHWLRV